MSLIRRYALGMELTDSMFKLVEVKKGIRRPRLTQYVVHPLLPVWMGEEMQVEADELIQSICDALVGRDLHTRRVHLTLSNRQIVTGIWYTPEMRKQRMRRWIEKKVLPEWELPFDDPLFDFEYVGHVWQDGDRQEVMVAAASRRYVEERVELVRWCGLEPVSVDLTAASLNRWVDYSEKDVTLYKPVFLHISRDKVDVSLFHYGVLQGCTVIDLPMNRFLNGMPDRISVDPLTPLLREEEQIHAYGNALLEALRGDETDWIRTEVWKPSRVWVLTGEGAELNRLEKWLKERDVPSVRTGAGPQEMMSEELQLKASRWLGASLSAPLGAALAGVGNP
ncbi:type IV pilus biogenesis protein PilM [Paludifilum halophilum]|nr:pilus assembly protein PilM [Paludifilum halophilum]